MGKSRLAAVPTTQDSEPESPLPTPIEPIHEQELTSFGKTKNNALLMGGVQLVLAEKRTSLSVLRTGITVFILPITVFSILIATSKHYSVLHTLHLVIPVSIANFLLFGLGSYLIIKAVIRMKKCDRQLQGLKERNPILRRFLH